jgi:hypothetical protein
LASTEHPLSTLLSGPQGPDQLWARASTYAGLSLREAGVTDDGKQAHEVIGELPRWVLERLWPCVEGDCVVWLSMPNLRRHLDVKADRAARARLLDSFGEVIRDSLTKAEVYVRYAHVSDGDAGVNALVRIEQRHQYLVVGLRIAGSSTHTTFSHVTTVFTVDESRVAKMLARNNWVSAERELDF